jgi:hypothetical protein
MHVNAFHTKIFTMKRHKSEPLCYWVPLRLSLLAYMFSDPHLKFEERGRNAMFQAMGILLIECHTMQ